MSEPAPISRGIPRFSLPVLGGLLLLRALMYAAFNSRYGYQGDELYFIACGEHLDLGYVDHPPLVGWVAWLSGELFGYSMASIRVLPALAGAASIFLTMLVARELGGGRFAQFLAGFAVLSAPAFLVMGGMLDIPVFEQVFWTLAAYLLVLMTKYDRPRLWLLIGVVAGVGLLNKHTMLLWGVGIAAGMLLTQHRKHLATPWPWLGGIIALALFAPNLYWQVQHDWPTLEFIRNMKDGTLANVPRVLFALGQLLYMNPFYAPLWLLGLYYFFSRDGKPYRILGWLYIVVFLIFLAGHGKPYYLAPAYPALFAGGAVWLEQWTGKAAKGWLRPALATAAVTGGLLLAPFSTPMLPLPQLEGVVKILLGWAVKPQELTGDFRRQLGWPEYVEQLDRLVARERQGGGTSNGLAILSNSYSLASAVNHLDDQERLPQAYSGHMSCYFWGPPPDSVEVVLAHGYAVEKLEQAFDSIVLAGELEHPLGDGGKQAVYRCTGLHSPWAETWPLFRKFDHAQ